MLAVIAASRAESGCLAYTYSADIAEPGLFHVHEEWDNHDALDRHFASSHMRQWQSARTALGFSDRTITVHEVTSSMPI